MPNQPRDIPESRLSLAEGFAEFARPNNGKDWSRLILGVVAGIMMLLAGRIWGESLFQETQHRAIQNAERIEAQATRFEDHVKAQGEQNVRIISELAEIRRLLQERPDGPQNDNEE